MEARPPDSDSLHYPIHPQQGALTNNVQSNMANPSLMADLNPNPQPSDYQPLGRTDLPSDDTTTIESSSTSPMKPLSALQRIHLRLQTSSCKIKDFVSDKADRLKNAFSP